ncbi:VOC family protein [Pseudonocardia sediminis]|nr:VOC family protein [Pseudonocardia sediminis]
MIFVNLPVADVAASRDFYSALGFTINEQFSDENTASVVISDAIVAMIMNKTRFADFTKKQIVDAHSSTEVINALGVESRDEVDRLADAALAAGATVGNDTQDHGFMYGRSFDDLDGHRWELVWMDPSAIG